jgi:hypothetical protein
LKESYIYFLIRITEQVDNETLDLLIGTFDVFDRMGTSLLFTIIQHIVELYPHMLGVKDCTLMSSDTNLIACIAYVNVCRYYINYKLMKKKVKQYGEQLQQGEKDRRRVLKDFSKMLDDQVMLTDKSPCRFFTPLFLICT